MLLFPSIYACTLLLYSFSQSCWYVWLAVAGKSLELTHNMHNTCAQTTTEGERILYGIRGIMELNDAHGIGNLRFFSSMLFFLALPSHLNHANRMNLNQTLMGIWCVFSSSTRYTCVSCVWVCETAVQPVGAAALHTRSYSYCLSH